MSEGVDVPTVRNIDGIQICATIEHIYCLLNSCCIKTSQIQHRQGTATLEHIIKRFYILCIEETKVESGQLFTFLKHISHLGHRAGIQIAEQCDAFQILHPVKPSELSRSCTSKRHIESHLGDFEIVAIVPDACFFHGLIHIRIMIDSVFPTCLFIDLSVIIECERTIIIDSIGGRLRQVARCARCIDTGIGLVRIAIAICCTISSNKACTIVEHTGTNSCAFNAPVGAYMNGFEIRTA